MTYGKMKFWYRAGALMNRFYKRISALPENFQEALFAELESAMENHLEVLGKVTDEAKNRRY